MDPVEQLRSLRDDSRWVEEELDFDQYALPVRRRWSWPRIAVTAAVSVAIIGLAVVVLTGVLGTQNVRPVPAGPAPTVSDSPVALPACEREQFAFGVMSLTLSSPPGHLVRAGWITAKNTSNTACGFAATGTPSVEFADDAATPLGGDVDSVVAASHDPLAVPAGATVYVPFAAYNDPGPQPACATVGLNGFLLNVPGWPESPYVADPLPIAYCGEIPNLVSWPGTTTMNAPHDEQLIRDFLADPPK